MTPTTPFEQERESIIARNKRILQELQIQKPEPWQVATEGRGKNHKASKTTKCSLQETLAGVGPRRSARLAERPCKLLSEESGQETEINTARASERVTNQFEETAVSTSWFSSFEGLHAPDVSHGEQSVTDQARIRGVSAVEDETLSRWLGHKIFSRLNPPKAAAVSLLSFGDPDFRPPKFSKYSGVAEMLDALAIFVNVDTSASNSYRNEFTHGGRFMSWFASGRMHEGTPAVQRMLRTLPNNSAKEGIQPGADRILLFLREPGEHYTFCGGLEAAGWVPASSPLKVLWRLKSFDALRTSAEFLRILERAYCIGGPQPLPAGSGEVKEGEVQQDGRP
mmetsp:Transcript_12978/g.30790  ORF Transcript_12978/g.30790 Transcript_12978/m.30790 type:complete len:338 (-) Transcript_12978:507-1520(-)